MALKYLNVTQEQVDAQPKIRQLLSKNVGGRARVFRYLRESRDPIARKIIERLKHVPERDLPHVPLEAICASLGLDALDVFRVIIDQL